MNAVYSLGLDVAKRKVAYHLLDSQRRRCASGSVPAHRAGLAELLGLLHQHCGATSVPVILEATGTLHLGWAEAFTQAGHFVFVLNPLVSKRLYSTANVIRDSKTDAVDAHGLAEIGVVHAAALERFRYRRDAARFGLQRLQTVRAGVRSALTNQRRAYVSLLDVVFPELNTLLDVHTQRVRALLAAASTPTALLTRSLRQLRAAFGTHTDPVLAAARASLAVPELAQASVPALRALLATITALETQLRQLDAQLQAQLAAVTDARQIALAHTVPGFGNKTVVAVLAQVPPSLLAGGPRRQAAARLQALMGNDPRRQESGQWKGQSRMSKRGNRCLRTAMFQAAFCAVIHDEELRAYYQKKRAEGKHHKVALSHVMRILTRRLVAVLMSGKPYEVCTAKLN